MRIPIVCLLFIFSTYSVFAQTCADKDHPLPELSDSTRAIFLDNLSTAIKKYSKDTLNADNLIWFGRRLAYLGKYRESIELFSKGVVLFPDDARFLRHRGHRYITLRCFDQALADLRKASTLIEGKEDEVEPDGIPNSQNIPTSTLHTNTGYHLGLVLYLQGNYKEASKAYEKTLKISDNNDMYIATLNWLYITLRRSGRHKEAAKLLTKIDAGLKLIENRDYLEILLAYKNNDAARLLAKTNTQETLSNATLGYGLGVYFLLKGDKHRAREIFRQVIKGKQWSSFGFIAAEQELKKL